MSKFGCEGHGQGELLLDRLGLHKGRDVELFLAYGRHVCPCSKLFTGLDLDHNHLLCTDVPCEN